MLLTPGRDNTTRSTAAVQIIDWNTVGIDDKEIFTKRHICLNRGAKSIVTPKKVICNKDLLLLKSYRLGL